MYERAGLWQLEKESGMLVHAAITPSKRVYVIAHPYWGGHSRDGRGDYIANLEALIRDTEFSVLTLEAPSRLMVRFDELNPAKRFAGLNPRGDRFFLGAGFDYPRPFCGWEITAEIINSFKPEDVVFGGSQLSGEKEKKYGHCVGICYETLKHMVPNPQIDESISDRVDKPAA